MFHTFWKNKSLQIHRSILIHHILNYCTEGVLLYLGKIVRITNYVLKNFWQYMFLKADWMVIFNDSQSSRAKVNATKQSR